MRRAQFLAGYQPAKLAAAEGLFSTGSHVPLHVGGIVQDGQLRYAIEIPDGLSLLLGYRPGTVMRGLDGVPVADRPPVTIVHLAFDVMVGVGFGLLPPATRYPGVAATRPVLDATLIVTAVGTVLLLPSLFWLLTLFQRGEGDLPETFTEAG